MLPVLVAVAVVLLVAAAAHDWRARRRGDVRRTQGDYWRGAAEARRREQRAHATRYFNRFLPKD